MPSPRLLNLLLLLTLTTTTSVVAIGDFPCAGNDISKSCADWAADPEAQGAISADAVCTVDPIHSTTSYCGYAHATCAKDTDCDWGYCGTDKKCKGYLGDTCTDNTDCQAFFFCPEGGGTCGGAGAACNNGATGDAAIPNPEEQCVSQVCSTSTQLCGAPPAAGVPNGFGCSTNTMCASGYCSTTRSVCATAPSGAAGGSKKVKRYVLNGSGPNVASCPDSQIACAVGSRLTDGFECIDARTNLEQCGGCVTDGEGEDCTAIHGVESVQCDFGRCLVLSCAPGLAVSLDGSACVV